MNNVEERYIHSSCCLEWLNESWSLLCKLRDDRHNPLVGAAFRFALILYAKPYRQSHGPNTWRLQLDSAFVPPEHLDLHDKVLAERDHLHAHSDLTVMDAVVSVHTFEEQRYALVVRNRIDPTKLLSRLDDVISLVEGSLDLMYVEAKRLEALLPLSNV